MLMFNRALFSALAVAAVTLPCGADSHSSISDWDAFTSRMEDHAATLGIETELAGFIIKGNGPGIRSLAEEIADDVGEDHLRFIAQPDLDQRLADVAGMERLAEDSAEMGLFENSAAAEQAIMSLGPCDMAGILVRHVALIVDDGTASADVVAGEAVIAGTDAVPLYDLQMQRCEVIGRLSRTERRIHTPSP